MKHYIILCLSVACFFTAAAQIEDNREHRASVFGTSTIMK